MPAALLHKAPTYAPPPMLAVNDQAVQLSAVGEEWMGVVPQCDRAHNCPTHLARMLNALSLLEEIKVRPDSWQNLGECVHRQAVLLRVCSVM